VIGSIPPDCDQIIELGGGWGSNLFHLWLGGGPADAEYVSLEPSGPGRQLSKKLAALAPGFRFATGDFDVYHMDLRGIATGRKVFVFSCYTLAMVRQLAADFFARLLAPPAICAGIHVEPGAWQWRGSSLINSRSRDYAHKHERNENFFAILERAHADGILQLDEVLPNNHAPNPLEPLSVIRWTRSGSQTRYTPGQTIDFSAGGDSLPFRRSGWSRPEEWGSWTDGPRACLSFALENMPTADTILVVDARGFVHSERPVLNVGINGNGMDLGQWEVSGPQKRYEVVIPASAWRPFGMLDVTLEIRDAQSPKELGFSEDERQLGLGVSTVNIA
jgi:hypothetical protein